MKFWKINVPNYIHGDYQYAYINGELEHPYRLPSAECEVCGEISGGGGILPFACPEKFRHRKEIIDGWPIPFSEHKRLQEEMLIEFKNDGIYLTELIPTSTFQPCFLDVPTKPKADFLWCSSYSVVISERIKNALEKLNLKGIFFCKVILRKIGKKEARLPPPVPSTGEPEDIINEVPLLSDKDKECIASYYELGITNESALPPGSDPTVTCDVCNRVNYSDDIRHIMLSDMWNGDDIFYLSTTSYIIITDSLKRYLEKLKPTNVVFKEIGPPEK